jgi:hypothetical protein
VTADLPAPEIPEIVPCPTPVEARVRCGGSLHRIRWEAGRITALDHGVTDLRFRQALETACRCAVVLEAIRKRNTTHNVPAILWRAHQDYYQHRTSLGHGVRWDGKGGWLAIRKIWLNQALRQRHAQIQDTLEAGGIRLVLEGAYDRDGHPQATVLAGRSDTGERVIVACHRAGRWHLDLDALLVASRTTSPCGGADAMWGDPGGYCRACHRSYAATPAYPGGVLRHAQTEKHAIAVRAIVLAAFDAIAPSVVLRAATTYGAFDVQAALARHAIDQGAA